MKKILTDRNKFNIDRKMFLDKISLFAKEPNKELLKDLIIDVAKIRYDCLVNDLEKFKSNMLVTPDGSGNLAKAILSDVVFEVTEKRIDGIIDVCFVAMINDENYEEVVSNAVETLKDGCNCKK